ncbi:helix-turn-helix domain-containing protein [Streptomyces milbemycinicus]|uniref:Helix-turn-helix domain-containing protein n=1 Tax=Streptomyces milbemycinicus TaxID=476552 RepID=A0ABW8LGM2_9ACTN
MAISVNANAIFAMRRAGEELQRLRVQAGLKQDDAAAELGVSRYTVSKVERGKAFPTNDQLSTLLDTYKASAEERAAIAEQIEQGRSYGRAWWEQPPFQSLFHSDSYRYFYLEDAAERLSLHSGTYVPGLLQTREYVEAIAAFGQKHESTEHREAFVETRMRRQAILTRSHPVTLDALCLESSLRAVVGGREVMRAQLQHLLASLRKQNINLRVVPFEAGAPSISGYPFTIIDFPGTDNRSVVSEERAGGDTLRDDPVEVRRSRRKFADLAAHALNQEETIRRIEEIEKELR